MFRGEDPQGWSLTCTVRSWMWVASWRPPITAAPVQMECPRMPPSVTPTMSIDAASPAQQYAVASLKGRQGLGTSTEAAALLEGR